MMLPLRLSLWCLVEVYLFAIKEVLRGLPRWTTLFNMNSLRSSDFCWSFRRLNQNELWSGLEVLSFWGLPLSACFPLTKPRCLRWSSWVGSSSRETWSSSWWTCTSSLYWGSNPGSSGRCPRSGSWSLSSRLWQLPKTWSGKKQIKFSFGGHLKKIICQLSIKVSPLYRTL